MTLKPTTRALIQVAKKRRKHIRAGAQSHAAGSIAPKKVASTAEQRYRSGHASGIRESRKRYGRAGAIARLYAYNYGDAKNVLKKKYGS